MNENNWWNEKGLTGFSIPKDERAREKLLLLTGDNFYRWEFRGSLAHHPIVLSEQPRLFTGEVKVLHFWNRALDNNELAESVGRMDSGGTIPDCDCDTCSGNRRDGQQ